MIFLSGAVRREVVRPDFGFMLTEAMGQGPDAEHDWAADNGCFARPHSFDWPRYRRWLEGAQCKVRLLWAVVPDVPGDHGATMARWRRFADDVRLAAGRVAFAAQDGATVQSVPWSDTDALFLGGTTSWKLSTDAARLSQAAKERGLWSHMGRVNSLRRMRHAAAVGCDSVDGTCVAFAPDLTIPRLLRALDAVAQDRPLPLRY